MLGFGRTLIVLFSAVLLLCISLPVAASAASLSGPPQGVAASPLKAPVYIHFHPKTVSSFPGGTVTVTAVVKNTGTHDYVATGCNFWYRLGTSGPWTKGSVCLNPADFPHTFPANSKMSFSVTQKVSLTFPPGVYEWKISLIGTYNGVTEKSHTGMIMATIT
jgi:hypothetical protein